MDHQITRKKEQNTISFHCSLLYNTERYMSLQAQL